jgi:hypothetical protein
MNAHDYRLLVASLLALFDTRARFSRTSHERRVKFPPRRTSEPDGVPINTIDSLRVACPGLKYFLNEVQSATNKFFYGQHTDKEWDEHYFFPSERLAEEEARRTSGALLVNRSRDTAVSWLNNYLFDVSRASESPQRARKVVLMIGAIGAGKSTSIKYITARCFSMFRKYQIIPSRIECAKFRRRLALSPASKSSDILRHYIRLAMVRDILLFTNYDRKSSGYKLIGSRGALFDSDRLDEFAEYVRSSSHHFGSNVRNSLPVEIEEYLWTKSWSQRKEWLEQAADEELDIIIDYAHSHGYKFVLVFDGFDYLAPTDFLVSKSHLLDCVAEVVWRQQGHIRLGATKKSVETQAIVLLRNNTLGWFAREHRELYRHQDPTIALVMAPAAADVTSGTLRRISIRSGFGPGHLGQLKKIEEDITQALMLQLRGGGSLNIGGIFNDNVRYQLRYLRDVILELIGETINAMDERQKREVNHRQLLEKIQISYEHMIRDRRYRLLEF